MEAFPVPYAERVPRRIVPVTPGEAEAFTHGMVAAGGGSTAVGDTVVGTVTLPANGPWDIFGVWSLIAAATETPGESFGGHLRLLAVDGDVLPNPAPSRFPTGMGASFLGATQMQRVNPLTIFPVQYQAPGKARLSLIYNEAVAVTVASQVVLGILFGKGIPERRPIIYIDRVRAQVAVAADTLVGTITLAEKASRIRWIGCMIVESNVKVAGEECLGFFRISSDDINMAPAQYPPNAAYSGGLGAAIEQPMVVPPVMIPVDIACPGGARVDCFIDLNTAVTNAAEVEIFVAYE